MDLIRKRQARNIQARTSCAGLFTTYCLFAFFSSVPLQTSHRAQSNLAPMAANLPVPGKLTSVENAQSTTTPSIKTGKWWQQHQEIAFLHEKWWQRHHPQKAAAILKKPRNSSAIQAKKAAKPAIKSVDKPAKVVAALAAPAKFLATPPVKPSNKPAADVKLAAIAPKPKVVVTPTPLITLGPTPSIALGNVTALTLQQPLKLAQIEQPAKVSLVGLSLPRLSSLGKVTKPPKSDFEQLLPAFIKKIFKSTNQRPATQAKAAHCVADNIAGWSGVKLLPQHVELLKKTSSVSPEISAGLATRLALQGFTPGSPVFMRIFKDKSELEVWLKKGERYALYHTYKICRWSGSFGPKLYEGDKQSPEGFYRVNRQLFTRPSWKWKGSFSIGYPNAYDKLHGRTGSLILVHGGCTSAGCFAMTDPVINEVHELAQLARDAGQKKFNLHVYPFKLTAANLAKHKNSPWRPFWNNLKEGYDLFAKTGRPARVRVCNKRYVFAEDGVERADAGWSGKGCYGLAAYIPGWKPASRYASKGLGRSARRAARKARRAGVRARCNLNRASCRKFVALKRKKKSSRRRAKLSRKAKSGKRRRLTKKQRLASKRRATMRRARAIGRKQRKKPFKSTGGNS